MVLVDQGNARCTAILATTDNSHTSNGSLYVELSNLCLEAGKSLLSTLFRVSGAARGFDLVKGHSFVELAHKSREGSHKNQDNGTHVPASQCALLP